jgi:hypothetical protein
MKTCLFVRTLLICSALVFATPARADLRAQLVGEWSRTYGTALRFGTDGKCMVAHDYTMFDKPAAKCVWSLDGDRLTMSNTDGPCSDKPEDKSGTYSIVIKEPVLRFKVIKDHCARRLTIDGQTWSRVDRTRPPAAAPAALDHLKLLAGTWRCVSRDPGDPHDTGTPSKLTIEPEYEGWSFVVRDDLADKSGYHASFGFDAEQQEVVALGREPLGAWFEAHSRGWEGDHITFAGTMHSGLDTRSMRWALKRSATEIIETYEKEVDGVWSTEAVERCQP